MTPAEILTEARRLIEEKGWTQGNFALDEDGFDCDSDDPRAVCYCSRGAMQAVSVYESAGACVAARTAFEMACGETNIIAWNDQPNRTREDVLSAFDRAIALAREAGR